MTTMDLTSEMLAIEPDISHIVTEDDTPVDNIFSERQQDLLKDSLYASWSGPGEERKFLGLVNVGLFYAIHAPPYVPDVLVSLDVQLPAEVWEKRHRSYFIWEYGKPPDVVIEIVSNREGGELDKKRRGYARLGIPYYIVYDPEMQLSKQPLLILELRGGVYVQMAEPWLPLVGLGVTLWQGTYKDIDATWLRWCEIDGELLPTGIERAEQERQRAERERQRAEREQQRAEQEHLRAERLAAQLRALGLEPEA
jgi:hypothetical protein